MGRLEEIQSEMLDLLAEAKRIVEKNKKDHKGIYDRMMAYWYPHIKMGLTSEHEFMGSCGATMQEAVDSIDDDDSLEALVEYAEGLYPLELAEKLGFLPDVFDGNSTLTDVIKRDLSIGDNGPSYMRELMDELRNKP